MNSSNKNILHDEALRNGRGANLNPAGRYDVLHYQDDAEERTAPQTHIASERPRDIISYNASPDLAFDRTINPYRGCEHGCVYCFARPTHGYLGLSSGLDFETRLTVKLGAVERLREALRKRAYRPAPIMISGATDPYQPIETRYGVTREILETLLDHRHPAIVVTKGASVLRHLDVLGAMADLNLVTVALSITTLDHRLSRLMEPRAASPQRRLAAVQALAARGVPTRVLAAPMIPALNDHELEGILQAAAKAGAKAAGYTALRLPFEVKDIFKEWLTRAYPDRAARILGHVRAMHGGADYDAQWGKRMRGEGPYAALIARRFKVAAARLGLSTGMPTLRSDLFRPPAADARQADLFGDA